MNDLKCMLDNSDSHQFLAIVTAMHHHGVSQSLHNGTLKRVARLVRKLDINTTSTTYQYLLNETKYSQIFNDGHLVTTAMIECAEIHSLYFH